MELTSTERMMLDKLLEMLDGETSYQGCDEFDVLDTPEARELFLKMYREDNDEDIEVFTYKGNICFSAGVAINYFRKMLTNTQEGTC